MFPTFCTHRPQIHSGDPKPVSSPGVRARHLCGQSIDPVAILMSFALASPFAEQGQRERPLTLRAGSLLQRRQVLFGGRWCWRQRWWGRWKAASAHYLLAPVGAHAAGHEKPSRHTLGSSAPSSTRPLSRNDGFPIASCHSSDGKWCFDGASPPIAEASSEEFESVVMCRESWCWCLDKINTPALINLDHSLSSSPWVTVTFCIISLHVLSYN